MRGLRLTGSKQARPATLLFNKTQPIGVGTCGWGSVLVWLVVVLDEGSGAMAGCAGTRTH
jgi:hypothetical protein